MTSDFPARQGLYDPAFEHDACGVAFVADIVGRVSHGTVEQGITALENMEHRGASGSEPATGDGAGLLVQIPDAFLRPVLAEQGVVLPEAGHYAVGNAFLAQDAAQAQSAQERIAALAAEEGLAVLVWRSLPVDPDGAGIGATARSVMPRFSQLVLVAAEELGGSIVAIAELARNGRAGQAEAALLVVDAYQREGIGSAIATRLVTVAPDHGITSVTAEVRHDNQAIRRLVSRLGLPYSAETSSGTTRYRFATVS